MATKTDSESKKTTSASAKLARRKNRGKTGDNPVQAEYESLNHEVIVKLIDAVAIAGGTVTFGTTKDGGAYYISYWCDGESLRHYIRPTENPDTQFIHELEYWLE